MTSLLGKGFMLDKELAQELTDQDFLYDFAKNNHYDRFAEGIVIAVRKLTDSARVAEFISFNNAEVQRAAAGRMKELGD